VTHFPILNHEISIHQGVESEPVSPQQINFCLYTSDVTEYKGAFVLCDVTCINATTHTIHVVYWDVLCIVFFLEYMYSKYNVFNL
jgi:hypothetical protein